MKTYTRRYKELNSKEEISFLELGEWDSCLEKALKEIIIDDSLLDVQVAFAINEDGSIVAVDYRVFDPMHTYYDIYTYADGWSNWFFENYDEDEEVDEVTILKDFRKSNLQ